MHVLVSNHEAEIAAFRRAAGRAGGQIEVVDNNLAALSLIGSRPGAIESLVLTEHQDEGINVETRTFVRNLAARVLDACEIVVVGPLFVDLEGPSLHAVETIDEAAALVREMAVLQPVGVDEAHPNGNGHSAIDLSETVAVWQPEPSPSGATETDVVVVPGGESEANFVASAGQASDAQAVEMITPARSLADDIRDWTERNEEERGRDPASGHPGLLRSLQDLLPTNRRLKAEEAQLDKAIRAPRLTRCHSVAVISPKGGVGKSFLTYLIGNFLADVRGDKVVAIDTNPDFGTLADNVRGREEQTVSSLLASLGEIHHYSDLRRFTSKVESRLEVLAAPADPDVMATITADDYRVVNKQLQHYYDTVIFDCGTGFRDDITRFALQECDQVVLVSAPLFITTGIVIRALGYLDQLSIPLDRVTLAINQVRREQPLDLNYMRSRFGSRLNGIVEVPFDMELYRDMDRGEFSVDGTQLPTRVSLKQLASSLAKHFV